MSTIAIYSPGKPGRWDPVHVFVSRTNLATTFGRRFCQTSLNVFDTDAEALAACLRCGTNGVAILAVEHLDMAA